MRSLSQKKVIGDIQLYTSSFGFFVAVSADRVFVFNSNEGNGHVYVFDDGRNKILKFTTDEAYYAQFGQSVAFDEDTLVVGTADDSAYILDKNGTKVTHLAPPAEDVDEWGIDFSVSVGISGDIIAVGSTGSNGIGAVYLFDKSGSLLRKLTADSSSYEKCYFV